MALSFTDVRNVIDYQNSTDSNKGYSFPLLPKFNSIVGNIEQSQTHVISGLPSSGVSSFIDQNYVMSLLLQWYNTVPSERQKLKIFYYSMKDSELKKLQLLLCNYIKLVHNLKTDIATLNNKAGKLYDLKNDKALNKAIAESSKFFDEVIGEEVLLIKDGQKKPTDIYNDIEDYMYTIGEKASKDSYIFNDGYEDQITVVIVDAVDHLLPDNEGYGILTGSSLDEKFQRQIKVLKQMFKVSFVLSVPSVTGFIRSPKDTEPHYRHLGSYGSLADKGICVYNPLSEKNVKFYNGEEDTYISPRGSVLLRTWHVVRNTDGIESAFDRMLFLPGTSYLVEYLYKEHVESLDDVLDVLMKESCFYI